MEENSLPRFWPDFLSMILPYATSLGVLENIQSLALWSKTGLQEADFNFKPNYSDFDHFDKMVSSPMNWRDDISISFGPI